MKCKLDITENVFIFKDNDVYDDNYPTSFFDNLEIHNELYFFRKFPNERRLNKLKYEEDSIEY